MASITFEYIGDESDFDYFKKFQLQPCPLYCAKVTSTGGMFVDGNYFGQCKFNGKIVTVEPYVPIDSFTKSRFQITLN